MADNVDKAAKAEVILHRGSPFHLGFGNCGSRNVAPAKAWKFEWRIANVDLLNAGKKAIVELRAFNAEIRIWKGNGDE